MLENIIDDEYGFDASYDDLMELYPDSIGHSLVDYDNTTGYFFNY